jgi:hypothetical protein
MLMIRKKHSLSPNSADIRILRGYRGRGVSRGRETDGYNHHLPLHVPVYRSESLVASERYLTDHVILIFKH